MIVTSSLPIAATAPFSNQSADLNVWIDGDRLMPRATHPLLRRPGRRGLPQAHPRVPTIISAGVVIALLVALAVAAVFLSTELVDPSTFEDGADPETLVMSGTVLIGIVGFSILLVHVLRKGASSRHQDKDPILPV
jgi:hypothetical protein